MIKSYDQPEPDADLEALIHTIYHQHKGRYGYRRICYALRNKGYRVNHKKVQRLMKKMGLASLVRIKKYRSYKEDAGKAAPNTLNRNFTAHKPNQKWVTDITEFKLFGQKLYLSPMLDLYNGEIIAYNMGPRPTYSLVSEMLTDALTRLTDEDQLMIHSDQGWHYRMQKYRDVLTDQGITQSMSRKGNCYDNAVIENFFGHLKSELLYLIQFESLEHFKRELVDYIAYYNTERIKSKLNGMSPVAYRTWKHSA